MLKTKSISIFVLILVFVTALFVNAAQSADIVDSTFNPQIQTSTFRSKYVKHLIELPDRKILAAGNFNTYNGIPVGTLIRLNPDASLDTTFNNDLLEIESVPESITLLPDGKIILQAEGTLRLTDGSTYTNTIFRLNADGTVDSSFNYMFTGFINEVKLDSSGRILVSGNIPIVQNGVTVNKGFIRLKNDGSNDSSFNAQGGGDRFTTQSSKIVYTRSDITVQQSRMYRLNEDGTNDTSFIPTLVGNAQILEIKAQADNKILILSDHKILRINENGEVDPDFQITTSFSPGQPRKILLQNDGRITIAYSTSSPYGMRVIRLLPNGASDPSFTPYNYPDYNIQGHTLQQDGSVIIGDQSTNSASNRFIRLLPSGLVDTSFNPGGSGFQHINPGKIRAISVLANEKILIGGDFDRVNNINRTKIARLNSDSNLDTTFQINTNATGNYFSEIRDVYHFAIQNDGKIIVSGFFDYFVNGVQKRNLVRLDSSGGIDPTFELSLNINDSFVTSELGKNKPLQRSDGKILIGTTRPSNMDTMSIPLLLTASGSKDSSFNPTIFNTKSSITIYDIALQSDGKIIISGKHDSSVGSVTTRKGYIARLNSDGTVDESFQAAELLDRYIFAFTILQNGQILIVSGNNIQNTVSRLNSNGSQDYSFNTETGTNGRINAISVLPNNKILVGGAFSTYDNQPRQNLAMLNPDGTLDANFANTNREVLCITVDNRGRVLVGGHFTSISSASEQSSLYNKTQNFSSISSAPQQVVRSYLARLIVSSEAIRRPFFDFDGDGKSDFSIYRAEVGEWWYLRSSDGGNAAAQFGTSTDKIVPADYTGDGKTDFAFYRPESGEWFILRSEDFSYYAFPFGVETDIPVPADYDGDGKADAAVFRPSTQVWYILKSTAGVIIQQYGEPGDLPIPADYNGDGKAEFAVYKNMSGFKSVVADYTGDGKADSAFYDPATNNWIIQRSENATTYTVKFGTSGDIPTPGDYDGDGKTDLAIYRPSTATWWYAASSANGQQRARQFGLSTDIPAPSAYIPQ